MRACLRPSALALLATVLCGLYANAPQVSAQTPIQPGQVVISELRLRGPGGAEDEFIELYNNTNSGIRVQATDNSAGWTVAISNGQFAGPLFTIPNGTLILSRGHLLGANSNGYSLSAYPSGNPNFVRAGASPFTPTTPDHTWDFDIPDGTGVALFSTTNGTNLTAATRLDAFGFTNSPALYKEGAGFPTVVTAGLEHTYYRDLRSSTPRDTGDNAADFLLVGTTTSLQIHRLGAPGPQNSKSPNFFNAQATGLLDPHTPPSSPPNRERHPGVEPNANLGTLRIRRKIMNGNRVITRLRFRVIIITTLGTPPAECGGQCADVRALTSQDGVVFVNGQPLTVRGLRLEEPPAQPNGGGYNATLSADFVTLATPIMPFQWVNVEFKLGIMAEGPFRFILNVESLEDFPPTDFTGPEAPDAGADGMTDPARRKRFVWEREPLTPAAPETPPNPAATPRNRDAETPPRQPAPGAGRKLPARPKASQSRGQ